MPAPPTPCLEPTCHNHATNMGRCDEHQRDGWATRIDPRKKRLPPDWATRSAIVMNRDHGICHLCGGEGADSVDHITAGDNHSLENLAPAHLNVPPYCHRYKSAAEGHAARRAMQAKPKF